MAAKERYHYQDEAIVEELKLSDFPEDIKPVVVFLNSLLAGIKELNTAVKEGFKEIRDSHASREDLGFLHSRVDAQSKRIDMLDSRFPEVTKEVREEIKKSAESFDEKFQRLDDVYKLIRNIVVTTIVGGVLALLLVNK